MVINTVMSHQFKFKFIPGFRTFLFPEKKDIHYIGGSEVLPAPLAVEEEAEAINRRAFHPADAAYGRAGDGHGQCAGRGNGRARGPDR